MNKDIGLLTIIGNQKRTEKLSAEKRREIASIAAKARWAAKHQREALLKQREAHTCTSGCLCTCGVKQWKHSAKNHPFDCSFLKDT